MDTINPDICRCCFATSTGPEYKDMLTESITENSSLHISDYFLLFSGISLEKDHLGPTKICQSCEVKLRGSFEFRELIISKNIKIEKNDDIKEDDDSDVLEFASADVDDGKRAKTRKRRKTDKDSFEFCDPSTDIKIEKEDEVTIKEGNVTLGQIKQLLDSRATFSLLPDPEDLYSEDEMPIVRRVKKSKKSKSRRKVQFQLDDRTDDFPDTDESKLTMDIESDYLCFVCDKIIKSYRLLKLHRTTEHGNGSHNRICNICSEQTETGYSKHIAEKHRDYKPHSCDFCSKRFQYAFELCNHLFNHVEGKKFKCLGCGEAYKTIRQLRAHVSCAKHNDRYSCPSCGMGFHQIRLFMSHFNEKHEEIKTKLFPCDSCNRIFMMKKFFEDHSCNNDDKSKGKECNELKMFGFKCELCPKRSFKDEEQLLCHQISIHENPQEKYICDSCNQEFPFKFLLERHWAATHQENSFQCDDCGKCFSNRRGLQIHKIVHKEIRDIKCPNCPSAFKDNRYLKQHVQLVHSGQKNFKCDVCERLFGTMGSLKSHMGTHFEDLRKFECELCQKKFICVFDRDRHIQRTHRDERPYKCDQCPNAYYAGNHLRDHQRSAHSDVRFECKFCGNRYARSKSLVEHIFCHLGYKPFNCPATECLQGFVKKETFKKHLTKSHSIQFDEALHGFKTSFQDILKAGLKVAEPTVVENNMEDNNQLKN